MTLDGTTKVCCPICGIYGTGKIRGDKLSVEFTEEEMKRSRLKFEGVLEHQVEQGRRDRYPNFDAYVEKFKKIADEL